MQADNPVSSAAYPVMLACPVVPHRLGIGVVADTASTDAPGAFAVSQRTSLFRKAGLMSKMSSKEGSAVQALNVQFVTRQMYRSSGNSGGSCISIH